MTNGQRVVTLYFVFFYVLPMAVNALAPDRIETIYLIEPLNLYSWMLAGFSYVLTMVLTAFIKPRTRVRRLPFAHMLAALGAAYERGRLLVALALLALAINYYAAGLTNFRYTEFGISDLNSPLLVIVSIVNVGITLEFFYRIFVQRGAGTRTFRKAAEDVILACSLLLSTDGTASSLMALAALVYALAPAMFLQFVFVEPGITFMRRLRMVTAAAVLGVVLFIMAWISGEVIKNTSYGTVSLREDMRVAAGDVVTNTVASASWVTDYFYYVVSSVSHAYYALTFTSAVPRDVLNGAEASPVMFPLRALQFRLDYLMGSPGGVQRPQIGSTARWNYVLLSAERTLSDRQGTSPGLLAAFAYVFSFPFDILFCVVYTVWLVRLIDRLVPSGRHHHLSVGGVLMAQNYLLFAFQSPIDFVQVFDNATLSLVGLVVISMTAQPWRGGFVARPDARVQPGAMPAFGQPRPAGGPGTLTGPGTWPGEGVLPVPVPRRG